MLTFDYFTRYAGGYFVKFTESLRIIIKGLRSVGLLDLQQISTIYLFVVVFHMARIISASPAVCSSSVRLCAHVLRQMVNRKNIL